MEEEVEKTLKKNSKNNSGPGEMGGVIIGEGACWARREGGDFLFFLARHCEMIYFFA